MKMKKHLFALLAALLCMVMLMGCTAHAGPESNKLTEAESNKLTEAELQEPRAAGMPRPAPATMKGRRP